jgi:hypothetical protein
MLLILLSFLPPSRKLQNYRPCHCKVTGLSHAAHTTSTGSLSLVFLRVKCSPHICVPCASCVLCRNVNDFIAQVPLSNVSGLYQLPALGGLRNLVLDDIVYNIIPQTAEQSSSSTSVSCQLYVCVVSSMHAAEERLNCFQKNCNIDLFLNLRWL